MYNLAEQAEHLTISPAAAGVAGRNVLGVRPMIRTSPSDRVSHHHNSDQLRDILNPIRGIRDMQRRWAPPKGLPCWAPLLRSQDWHATTSNKGSIAVCCLCCCQTISAAAAQHSTLATCL